MAGRCPEAGCVPCFLKVLAQGWNLRVHEGADGGSPWLYGSPSVWPCLGGGSQEGLAARWMASFGGRKQRGHVGRRAVSCACVR